MTPLNNQQITDLIEQHGSPLLVVDCHTIREKYLAIVNGLRNSRNMLGDNPHFVIGLSGGIDSSLVATLLVLAFGKERVIGVNMP